MKKFVLFCTTAMLPAAAYAQSTGTTTFENEAIVVTGTRGPQQVGGVTVPDTPKARGVLTQEFIGHQTPGQSIDDIINYLPGVSFQNNGPYGDAGGTLTIHGFDSSRISQTFDGVPTNDSGNYALYSQEQIDPELIQQVNVSFGSTDIDSPTASATGGTVNYNVRDPSRDMHVRLEGSLGDWDFQRAFGVIDTGVITPWGTRAFIAASHSHSHDPYNQQSQMNRTQFNAKIYQPLGSNGDFISLTGFYDRNRGNHFGDVYLRSDKTINGIGVPAGFPTSADLRDYTILPCTTTPAIAGHADKANTCGTAYDYSYNPVSIARVHLNSRFTLADGLILTVEPNYEFNKANGGAAVTATEGSYLLKNGTVTTPITGFISGKPYFGGVDLNGDGDTLDTVELSAPSNTVTHRYGVLANLIYRFSPSQTVRLNYSLDHAQLLQTGELGYLSSTGFPLQYFPSDDPILDATGNPMEKRNRTSYSILNQVSAQYRGQFFDDRLTIEAGVRAPFFKRDLNNHCVAESAGNGYVDCFNDPTSQAAFLAAHAHDAAGPYQAPQSRNYKYHKLLPSAGVTYNLTSAASLFFDYSEGLQVPSTDTLYDSFAFPVGTSGAAPKPETTYNFEGGLRYRSRHIQAQLSGWYTDFKNRIEEASVPDPANPGSFISVYNNLGTVHKYGVDGSVAYAPVRQLTFYVFGSYLKSKILNDTANGACTANNVTYGDSAGTGPCTRVGQTIYALTAGRRESDAPTYTLGGRAQANLGPVQFGVQAKRTGPRYLNDQNTPLYSSTTVIFPAKTPAYTLVDLDARVDLSPVFAHLDPVFGRATYLQVNVTNLFDKFYVGGFAGNLSNTYVPYVYIGTPRTVSATLNLGF